MQGKKHKPNLGKTLKAASSGAIAILLSVALLPFFSLAAILVETGRYQSSVRALDGALGSSSLSALSEYETYLYDRFGVLAVKQTDNESLINDEVAKYLSLQKTTDMRGVSLDSVEAAGVYPLADTVVLRQQLLDYSAVLVPAKVAVELSGIDNLISQLEKWGSIGAIAQQLSSGAKLVGSEADTFVALEDAKKQLEKTKEKIDTYNASFSSWSSAVSELASHLATTRPDGKEHPILAADWDATKTRLELAASLAAGSYSSDIQSLINELETLHTKMADVITKVNAMTTQTVAFATDSASALDQVEADDTTDDETKTAYKNIITANKTIGTTTQSVAGSINSTLETFTDDNFSAAIASLQGEKSAVDSFDNGSASGAPDAAVYHHTDLGAFADGSLTELLNELDQEVSEDAGLDALLALVDFITNLFNTELLFDGRLNSTLDTDYYDSTYGGLPSSKGRTSADALLEDFVAGDEERSTEYLAEIDPDYDESDPYGYENTGTAKLDRFVTTLENFLNSFSDIRHAKKLVDRLVACAATIGYAADLFSQLSSIGAIIGQAAANFTNRLVLMGYFAYDLPNRTTFRTGSTLTGYSYSKAALAQERTGSNVPIVGEVSALSSDYVNYAFCGAELEYLMYGNASEIANQTKAFLFLWVMRTLIDLIPAMSNAEVTALTAPLNAVPVVGPVLAFLGKVAMLMGESLVDSYVLVNGGEVTVLKKTLYLTPSGLPKLLGTVSSLALSTATQNTLKNKAQKWAGVEVTEEKVDLTKKEDKPLIDGDKYVDSLLEFDYTEHLLFLMCLFGNENTYLNRLADLMQCEMTQRNLVTNATMQQGQTGAYYFFDIEKAYTAIRVHATGSTVQVLPVPTLSASSQYRFDRVLYRGY